MKNINLYTTLFILTISSSTFCQSLFESLNKNSINRSQIIATVDSIDITAEEIFYSYEFGPAFTMRHQNSREVHLDFMINEKLIALKGFNQNGVDQSEEESLFNDIQSDIATEELYKDSILTKVNINDQEINRVMYEKNTELEVKWLFENNAKMINDKYSALINGESFDSLFIIQINDSVFLDERSQKSNIFNLRKKNSLLAAICDTLQVGNISRPLEINNEWYIIKITNRAVNILSTESQLNKIKKESVEALTKFKLDSISDNFVNKLLIKNNPIIKRNAFNILRTYIGKFRLESDKYDEWDLENKLDDALNDLGLLKENELSRITLIELNEKQIVLADFIKWFKNRNLYIKLPKTNLMDFSKSLENLVWLMVRDNLLADVAKENKYYNNSWVKTQSEWWKEKISYSSYRNKLVNSIKVEKNEIAETQEGSKNEFTKRLFREVTQLRKKYKIKIDYELLNEITLSTENDKRAINFYTAKNKGLIPRPPYPTIDSEWSNWL